MNDRPLPYYRWYVMDYRASRTYREFTWEERGVYREILDECWVEGAVPDDAKQLSKLCGVPLGKMAEVWEVLREHFSPAPGMPDPYVTHPRLEAERTERDRERLSRKRGGLIRGEQIRQAHLQDSSSSGEAQLKDSLASSSSSSSISNSKEEKHVADRPRPDGKKAGRERGGWCGRFASYHDQTTGASVQPAHVGKVLKPLIQRYGEERVFTAWQAWCAEEERFSVNYFASHFEKFDGVRVVKSGAELFPGMFFKS